MVVSTDVVARRYEDVSAGTPISVDIPAYEAGDVYVYYGNASLLAVQGTDYTVALAGDFETFTVTPTASLLTKINALIAGDATEENYIVVRRTLDYLTDATPAGVRYTPYTSREFDRNAMRDLQLAERVGRALQLPPSVVPTDGVDTSLLNVKPGQYVKYKDDGTGFVGAGAQLVVSEVDAWFQNRDVTSAAQAALLTNGSVVVLNGLSYRVDSSATGAASATSDLGVDGLVPYGVEQPGHYGGIAAMVASSRTECYIPPGTYVLANGLDLSKKRSVSLMGDVVLDFTGITDAANVPGRGYLNLDGGDLVALPDLASDTTVGATSIVLASAPSGIAEGDWICIYDPTNFSFSGFKSSYRDGQWCKVAGVSGSTITLYTTILRAYAAATVEVYKHPGTTFKIDGPGNIVIKESLVNDVNLNAKAGFCATRYVDVDFSKIRSTQSDYGSMLLRQCLEVHGTGYKTQQFSARTAGYNYGVVAVGCQHIDIQGDFYGYNHSFTVGGGDGPGYVPTRYVKVSGTFNAHPTTTIGAANFHGHCEYIHYDGFFDGAVSGGGDYIKVSGTVRGRGNQSCFYMNEMRGANVDLSGVRIETQGNPHLNTSGVIDIGANTINQLNADTVNGGTIDMRGVTIYAPNSQRGMVIRNRGCVQGVALDVTGMKCTLASGGIHYIDAISGSNFTALYMRDASLGTTALNNLRNIDKFYGWEVVGEIELTTLTSQPNRSASVSYQAPWNLVPNIITALNGDRIVGGKPIVHGAESRTNTAAFIFLNSADNANFTSSEACKIAYRITV